MKTFNACLPPSAGCQSTKKLLLIITAVLCAAWTAPVALWGADDLQRAPGKHGQAAELTRLKAQVTQQQTQLGQQQKQIESLQQALTEQQKLVEKIIMNDGEKPEGTRTATSPEVAAGPSVAQVPAPVAATDHKAPNLGDVASMMPIIPAGTAPVHSVSPLLLPSIAVPPPATAMQAIPESPLQFHIGNTTFTPVGFMDMTNTFRSTNSGANLATNFGSIPYNNTVGGRLTENKLSPQNSRLGLRVDGNWKGFQYLGYWESDFVGSFTPNNVLVTSNSYVMRLRLFWVDVRKSKYEVLAGQSWSLITPNRRSISPLPGDLFYGQEFDVNYLNGLTWGRIPGFRFVYHPSEKVAWGISAENSTQYFGGSGGGGIPTLPAAFSSLTTNQLDASVVNGYGLPNVFPDIISKLAFDPSPRAHIEINGVLDHAKIINPNNPGFTLGQYHSTTGGGGSINGNFEIVKNFRIFTNNFWSSGAGRYLFGLAPNFIVRANGSLSNVHAGSTVDGFEWQATPKSMIYAYYGGVYINRNTALDTNGAFIGYGYPGSPNSQNRTTQEATAGWNYFFFRDPKYGSVNFYLDYAYFFRNPWFVAPNQPKSALQHAVWFDLRYTLPGAAPTITYR